MKFSVIVQRLITREGGYVSHPDDNGGATRYGMTEKMARRLGYRGAMQDLPLEFVIKAYDLEYWQKVRGDQLSALGDGTLAEAVFDFAVLAGVSVSSRTFQKAINTLSGDGLKLDGVIGSRTIASAAEIPARPLRIAFAGLVTNHFLRTVDLNASQRVFVRGWLVNRVWLR